MNQNIEKKNSEKLVIATSSRALFDLEEAHKVFDKDGVEAYEKYQIQNENKVLDRGVGFRLIEKLLALSEPEMPIELILLSRNTAHTGLRICNSLERYNIKVGKMAFTGGAPIFPYVSTFKPDLFLSVEQNDVSQALSEGLAAAKILTRGDPEKNLSDKQLRIAFDGDAVIFGDQSEKVFQTYGIEVFNQAEKALAHQNLTPGPFKPFLELVNRIQTSNRNAIRIALVTARGMPAHKRVVKTLRKWGIRIDESFFLDGGNKTEVLKAFMPDMFFDDLQKNCDNTKAHVPTAHVSYPDGT